MFNWLCKRRRLSNGDDNCEKRCVVVVAAISGASLCIVPFHRRFTVEDLRQAVKAELAIEDRIDFLYDLKKLSEDNALLEDILEYDERRNIEVGLVKAREIVINTQDDGYYTKLSDVRLFSEGSLTYTMFTIAGANNDVHIGLFPGNLDVRQPFYEIVIDGWGGDLSGIRLGRGAHPVAIKQGRFLLPEKICEFWVSVDSDSKIVAFGTGSDTSQNIILEYTDPAVMIPCSIGVMTKHGASGLWTFIQ